MYLNANGPYPFGSSDPAVICTGKLTSASELGCGSIIGAGTPDYNSNGMLLTATNSWVFTPSPTERAKLINGGSFTFEIEQGGQGEGAFDTIWGGGGVNQDVCGWDDGSVDDVYIRMNGAGVFLFNYNGNLATQARVRPSNNTTHVEMRVDFDHGNMYVYMDNFLIRSLKLPAPRDAAEFTNITLGRNTLSSSSSMFNFRFRNVQIATRRMQRIVRPALNHVNMYGDSFVRFGQYGTSADQDTLARTEDGITGPTFDGQTSHDGGIIPNIQKVLGMNGLFVGGERIYAWHQGGTGVLTTPPMSDRVDISVGLFNLPTLAIFAIGTNDCTDGGTTVNDITGGNWANAYQASIDKLPASCIKILCTVTPVQTQASINTQLNRDKQDAVNIEVPKLVDANANTYLADLWTMFGGLNFDQNDFGGFSTAGADDRHPSWRGHIKIGQLIGQTILDAIV